ncbi:MAG: Cys-tRNA(Pro) deacylase [Ignavibacteriae bacterium]|nr:Cys-tRNA(Pro) deacylase [Ignavibacteriota bacterium]
MSKQDIPTTQAVRVLRAKQIEFTPHFYAYEERGGTRLSAESLGVPEHAVIKTIVLETQEKKPLICLMHGDQEISTKNLARFLGVKGVVPCEPATAGKHTGYMVGGTSPFGTTKILPVYVESSILNLERIYINGGKRGFLVEMNPRDISQAIDVTEVNVAITN